MILCEFGELRPPWSGFDSCCTTSNTNSSLSSSSSLLQVIAFCCWSLDLVLILFLPVDYLMFAAPPPFALWDHRSQCCISTVLLISLLRESTGRLLSGNFQLLLFRPFLPIYFVVQSNLFLKGIRSPECCRSERRGLISQANRLRWSRLLQQIYVTDHCRYLNPETTVCSPLITSRWPTLSLPMNSVHHFREFWC